MNEASDSVVADTGFAPDQQRDSGTRVFPDCHEVVDPGGSYDGRDAFARGTLSEHRPPPSRQPHCRPHGRLSLAAGPRRTYVVSSGETPE